MRSALGKTLVLTDEREDYKAKPRKKATVRPCRAVKTGVLTSLRFASMRFASLRFASMRFVPCVSFQDFL